MPSYCVADCGAQVMRAGMRCSGCGGRAPGGQEGRRPGANLPFGQLTPCIKHSSCSWKSPGHSSGDGVADASGWLCAGGCGANVRRRGGRCSRPGCEGRRQGRPAVTFLEVYAGCAALCAAARAAGCNIAGVMHFCAVTAHLLLCVCYGVLPPVDAKTEWDLPDDEGELRELPCSLDQANWVHFAPPCTIAFFNPIIGCITSV
eukprot:gene16312-441_t